ncbi:Protein disulfide-isomerase LQY1, chloroplastic [Linum grandiflorum]
MQLAVAASVHSLKSPFPCCPPRSSCLLSRTSLSTQSRPRPSSPHFVVRAIEMDANTVTALSVGLVSVAVGIGIPVFYESQINNASKRDNTQPCFPCSGSGAQKCRFCGGGGTVIVDLGGEEKEVSNCINCDGAGSLTCTTCQGSGIQPRYLDRREFKDDD